MHQSEKNWQSLSIEAKLDALHEEIGKLFSIAQEHSHKNHVFVDAINLLHSRLGSQSKAIQSLQKHAGHVELTD